MTILGAASLHQAPPAPGVQRLVTAADAFLATLDAAKRAKANGELNAKTRTIWSNLPTGIAMQVGANERNGLKLGDMTPAQEKAALALLVLVMMAEPALAHPPPLGVRGFWGGMLHPVLVTDHVVGILGLGLLIGGQERWGALPAAVSAPGRDLTAT